MAMTDAGTSALAVPQALLGYVTDARRPGLARCQLHHLSPYLPNKGSARWPAPMFTGATPPRWPSPPR